MKRENIIDPGSFSDIPKIHEIKKINLTPKLKEIFDIIRITSESVFGSMSEEYLDEIKKLPGSIDKNLENVNIYIYSLNETKNGKPGDLIEGEKQILLERIEKIKKLVDSENNSMENTQNINKITA